MSSVQLFPEVIDASTLGPKFSQNLFLPVAIEGQAAGPGTGVVGTVYEIARPSEADQIFGSGSTGADLAKFLMDRGVAPLKATVSQKGSAPTLEQRQAAWALLESDREIRLRLTDSVTQADHAALAVSCDNASKINNKQIALAGLASATSKSQMASAATAINSKRLVLVGPGVYDSAGVLKSGNFAAAAAAAEVAKNADPADDLDMLVLPNLTGIEKNSFGQPLLNIRVTAGTAVNDFEDLLQAGFSPLMPGRNRGSVANSHLRMTWVTDSTFDALSTRIIVDQIFILVREYAYDSLALRKGNTPLNRELLRSGIEALLTEHNDWLQPKVQSDNTLGYNVAVTASDDERQMRVAYEGRIVRNTQTILVDGRLEIAV